MSDDVKRLARIASVLLKKKSLRKGLLSKRKDRIDVLSNSVRKLKKNVEQKRILTFQASTQFLTSGTLLLNGCAQGDNEDNRDGKQIIMKGCGINLMVAPATVTTEPTYGIWILVLDRQPNGAAPSFADIYDTTTSTDGMLGHRASSGLERFLILARKDFVCGTIDDGCYPLFHEYIDFSKLKDDDKRVRYSGTGATITAIMTNSLYLLWRPSNQADFADGTNPPNISYSCLVKFTDK